MLLGSPPDMVHGFPLRKTDLSTPLTRYGWHISPGRVWGFIPAVADCRYRAPLSPRLVRPCPTPTGIRQTLVPMIQHFPGRCKNFRPKIFARFRKKGFTFLELLVYYCVVQSIRACSSVGRAFGSHPRGQGFKSLQVHHTPCPKHEKQQPSVPEGCCFLYCKESIHSCTSRKKRER